MLRRKKRRLRPTGQSERLAATGPPAAACGFTLCSASQSTNLKTRSQWRIQAPKQPAVTGRHWCKQDIITK